MGNERDVAQNIINNFADVQRKRAWHVGDASLVCSLAPGIQSQRDQVIEVLIRLIINYSFLHAFCFATVLRANTDSTAEALCGIAHAHFWVE